MGNEGIIIFLLLYTLYVIYRYWKWRKQWNNNSIGCTQIQTRTKKIANIESVKQNANSNVKNATNVHFMQKKISLLWGEYKWQYYLSYLIYY